VTAAEAAPASRPLRSLRSLLSALVVFLVLVLATAALKGWRDLERAREREATLASEVAAAEARIAEAQRRIERLARDPVTLDRLAREELGRVAPGDVVLVLPPAAAAPAPLAR
jgi:cell division protein FtsB